MSELVNDLFNYNECTGELFWAVNRRGHVRKGDKAGTKLKNGCGKHYLTVKIAGKHSLVHRVCWLYFYGKEPNGCIDHINGDGLDNRIENLRVVSRSENQKNMKVSTRSSSGVMGVYWEKRSKKWHVRIAKKGVTNKMSHVGYYSCFLDAVCARKSLEINNDYHQNHGQNRPL